jgi:hypothetical protein
VLVLGDDAVVSDVNVVAVPVAVAFLLAQFAWLVNL